MSRVNKSPSYSARGNSSTYTYNRNKDNTIHNTGEYCSTGSFYRNNEWAGRCIHAALAIQEPRFVRGNQESNEQERDDIEDHDTPEYLLNSCGQGLARVGCLSGSQPYQFCACERCRRGHEDTTKALEAIIEGARTMPVLSSNVPAFWLSADVNNSSE